MSINLSKCCLQSYTLQTLQKIIGGLTYRLTCSFTLTDLFTNSKYMVLLYEMKNTIFGSSPFTGYLLECVNGIGTDYRGTKTKTKSGKTCQRWASRFPHKPK